MPFDLTCNPRPGYLELTTTGTVPTDDIDDTVRRIFAACVDHGARRVLVDVRPLVGSITTLRRIIFGLAMADHNYAHIVNGGRPPRFSFLGNESLVDPQRLGETVAVNRGVDVRISTDPDEALQYLLPDGIPA